MDLQVNNYLIEFKQMSMSISSEKFSRETPVPRKVAFRQCKLDELILLRGQLRPAIYDPTKATLSVQMKNSGSEPFQMVGPGPVDVPSTTSTTD